MMSPLSDRCLLDLAQEDQCERWGRGERPLVEEYLELYDALKDAGEEILELIVNEINLREALGEIPRCDEYVNRFPQLEPQLRVQFEVRQGLTRWDGERASERLPPPTFPGYDVVYELGRGGMGVVYLAYDRQHDERVALKTLKNLDPETLHRFRREFRLLADVKHENLVTLYDLVGNAETWFFTMEYIEGVPFLDYVRSTVPVGGAGLPNGQASAPLPLTVRAPAPVCARQVESTGVETASCASATDLGTATPEPVPLALSPFARLLRGLIQLTRGILALHDAGKIHRDIKPTNVLVTATGRVVLVDFGLATDLDWEGKHQSRDAIGTPAYMAPEQIFSHPVSRAADWYSVGVMIYEALHGQRPPSTQWCNTEAAQASVGQGEGCPPALPVGGTPACAAGSVSQGAACLDALCAEMLSPNPAGRPEGHSVLSRLEQIQARITPPLGTPSARTRDLAATIPPRTPFVGRRQHLEALRDAFATVRRRRTVFVGIQGASGVGKTALVQHFLDSLSPHSRPPVGARFPDRAPTEEFVLPPPLGKEGWDARGDQVVVLRGRCFEREFVPYKALNSLVDDLSLYLGRLSDAEVRAVLPTEVLSLARMFPVLKRVRAVETYPPRPFETPDPQEVQRQAFAALRELLTRLGDQQPLILFLDDLQWGDADSAELLAYLLGPRPPVFLLLACYRTPAGWNGFPNPSGTGWETHPTRPSPASTNGTPSLFLEQFARAQHSWEPGLDRRELVVEPLTAPEAHALAQELLGPAFRADAKGRGAVPAWAAVISRQSEGNPLFVSELVQYLHTSPQLAERPLAETGVTLGEVLWSRVRQLPEDARRLLEILAVSGQPLPQMDACLAAGVEANKFPALALLRANRHIRSTNAVGLGEVEIYHDRLRETILTHLPPEDLQNRHGRLAAVLEQAGHPDAEILAVHFHRAGEYERAGRYYARAARQADAELAFDRAVKLYRLALELLLPLADGGKASSLESLGIPSQPPLTAPHAPTLPPEGSEVCRLRIRLGHALANAGRGAESADEYLVAAPDVPDAEAFELRRQATLQFLHAGHVDKGLATLQAVLDQAGLKLPRTSFGLLWSLLWRRLGIRLGGLRFQGRPANEVPEADKKRIDIYWSAAHGLSFFDVLRGAYFQACGFQLARRSGDAYRFGRAVTLEAVFLATAGTRHKRSMDRLLTTAEALAQKEPDPYPRQMVAMARGIAAFYAGRRGEARAILEGVTSYLRENCQGVTGEIDVSQILTQMSLLYLGELSEFSRRGPVLYEEARQRDDLYAATHHGIMLVDVRLLADDVEGARRALDGVRARLPRQGCYPTHLYALFAEVQINLYAGQNGVAWTLLSSQPRGQAGLLLRFMQEMRIEWCQARGRTALACAGDRSADPRPFLRAAEGDARRLEGEKLPWADALARLLRAGVLAGRGDRAGALRLLALAVTAFETADMHLFAAAARRRQGEIAGGPEGAALVARADGWMAGQQVRNPARLAAVYAPVFMR